MNTTATLQLLAAALLILAGFLNLARARRHSDALKAKNARLSGYLFIAAGMLFLVLAIGFAGA